MPTELKLIQLNSTDLSIGEGKGTFLLRTDAPLSLLTEDELLGSVDRIIKIHKEIRTNLTTLIEDDSYIQIGSDDNVIIAVEAERIALVYPKGTFREHSALFYLNWLPVGMLLEVTTDENMLAKFVYKK